MVFSSGTPVSSTNKTDRHDITEILLKKHNPKPILQNYTNENKWNHSMLFKFLHPLLEG